MIDFDIIVAADEAGGIGVDGRLPWSLPSDMLRFRALTSGTLSRDEALDPTQLGDDRRDPAASSAGPNAVVMGRRTWQSLPRPPLAGRLNVVLSRSQALELPPGARRAHGLPDALGQLAADRAGGALSQVFVVGGGELYRQALPRRECRRVYLTRVRGRFDCDTYLPPFPDTFRRLTVSPARREGGIEYAYEVYEQAEGGRRRLSPPTGAWR